MDGGETTSGAEDDSGRKSAATAAGPLHLNVDEAAGCCGSDSGVDVTPAVSCDSSLASGCYDPCKSPLGPFSPTETSGGPSSLPAFTVGGGGGSNGYYHQPAAGGYHRPSTPTWRRTTSTSSSSSSGRTAPGGSCAGMSSSFHFDTGRRDSPPPACRADQQHPAAVPRKTDLSTVAKQAKISTVKKLVSSYDMVRSLDRYATLPRRRRKSKENLAAAAVSSPTPPPPSPLKEPSLNRAASLRRKHIEQGALAQNAAAAAAASSLSPPPPSINKPCTLPRASRQQQHQQQQSPVKTKIYHEICSQTCLTGEDIAKALSGDAVSLPLIENRVETSDAEIQVDLVEKRINALETELKEKTEQLDCKTKEFNEQQECLKIMQERLNHENLDTCRQIDAYSLRLCSLFQINDCLDPSPSNILEILEKQVTTTSSVINEQQKELNQLKTLCTSLHRDLEKSYAAQKSLLQANHAYEMESSEIQDFLQAEKAMMSDTIKDLEKEVKEYKEKLAVKEKEAAKNLEQCTHLVRISEQRRQENLSLQAKMRVMENKSREYLQQKEATASSAVVGLTGLGNRLDSLLDRLVKSYSISEEDIEDEVYFNEAYTNGDSSSDSEQQNGTSNKSDSKSLMSAIVSAIKSAPTSWQKGKIDKTHIAANTNTLESPCSPKPPCPPVKRLHTSESMKELQRTYSPVCKRNGSTGDLLLNTDSLDDCSDIQSAESESLNNLSEAIVARQQLELSMNSTNPGNFDFEFLEDFHAPDADLLDQVIDLDNTVTKLLKVITIVQTNGKEQLQSSPERHEIKYTNGVNGKSKQYSSQSPLIHDSDDSSYLRPTLVPLQDLQTNSAKALNGIM